MFKTKIDKALDDFSGASTDASRYRGIEVVGQMLYMLPFTADEVMVYNTTDDGHADQKPISSIPLPVPPSEDPVQRWSGGVQHGNSIYCIPHTNPNVLEINTLDNTATKLNKTLTSNFLNFSQHFR